MTPYQKTGQESLLIKEAHHRIKNSLQLIFSLLELQSQNVSQESKLELEKVSGRIKAISCLHDKLSQQTNPTFIDVGDYIKSLCSDFQSFNPDCQFRIKVESKRLLTDIAIPLGLILAEVLLNSLKYARSPIDIFFYEKEERLYLTIRDYGPGMPKYYKEGLGLKIIQQLAESIRAEMLLERAEPGVSWTFKVPANIGLDHG